MKPSGRSFLVLALFCGWAAVASAEVVLNVRDFGAIGDGLEHQIGDRETAKRFKNLSRAHAALPALKSNWSADEIAFELAKRALPPEGGVIYFPAGHYVATGLGWRIMRDNVTLRGDGPERTTLSTSANINDALALAGYRHVGWSRGYAFDAEEGAPGERTLTVREPGGAEFFAPGDLVFVRNGSNRYDQDYGEFNEVTSVEGQRITVAYPFSRDYRADAINWSGKLAADFTLPKPYREGVATFAKGEGVALPGKGTTVSIGSAVLRVVDLLPNNGVVLKNPGRANPAGGTVLPEGSLVSKERALIKLQKSTRNFAAEGLTIRGRRKALNLSNTWNSRFTDCVFERAPQGAPVKGGLTIDGDGGRFARFERCVVRAAPAMGMQFARSFAGVVFNECRFENTNVSFTEFNFDCEVVNSEFEVIGSRALSNVVIVGKSCGDLRIHHNVIRARNVECVFDAHMDIQSFKRSGPRLLVIRDNRIETDARQVFRLGRDLPNAASDNRVLPLDPGVSLATALPGTP